VPCRAVQRAKDDRRQLEMHTLERSQPMETGECVGDVVRAPQVVYTLILLFVKKDPKS